MCILSSKQTKSLCRCGHACAKNRRSTMHLQRCAVECVPRQHHYHVLYCTSRINDDHEAKAHRRGGEVRRILARSIVVPYVALLKKRHGHYASSCYSNPAPATPTVRGYCTVRQEAISTNLCITTAQGTRGRTTCRSPTGSIPSASRWRLRFHASLEH